MKLVTKLSIVVALGLFFAPALFAENHLSSGPGVRVSGEVNVGAGIYSPNACSPVRSEFVPVPLSSTPVVPPKPLPAEVKRQKPLTDKGCVIGGCNGELCYNEKEKGVTSLCAVPPDYQCYDAKYTHCKKDGEICQWERTDEFRECRGELAK